MFLRIFSKYESFTLQIRWNFFENVTCGHVTSFTITDRLHFKNICVTWHFKRVESTQGRDDGLKCPISSHAGDHILSWPAHWKFHRRRKLSRRSSHISKLVSLDRSREMSGRTKELCNFRSSRKRLGGKERNRKRERVKRASGSSRKKHGRAEDMK